jgi:PAS domain S-box-containing protein
MASIVDLLAAWRAAERRWELAAVDDERRAAASDVLAAWTAYQDAAATSETEFMLVTDATGRYVAATSGVRRILDLAPEELVGRTIADVAAPDLRATTHDEWVRFLEEGRQDGIFRLVARDGQIVTLRFHARAHHPLPGFHVSRLSPTEP